jgi:toxin ParE1/3/4
MKITYAEGVFEELVNLSFYLAEDDEELAQTFLNTCDETFRFLAENKFIGRLKEFSNPKLSEIRMWRVKGFERYLIFYKPTALGVKIIHIFHSAKDYNRVFEED